MKKLRILVLGLVLTMVLSAGAAASDEVEISGSLENVLQGTPDDGSLTDQEKVNLILERKFGFDADMYLDLGFESTGKDSLQEAEVNIEEAYLNYYTRNVDWRLGKQELNWGSAYKLQPTDYFNPRDLTALKPLDEKTGVKAVKGTYYAPQGVEVTGVVTPFFATHQMSQKRKGTVVDKLKSEAIAGIAEEKGVTKEKLLTNLGISEEDINYNLSSVKDNVDNTQGGIKLTKRSFKGFDLSGSFYHGRDKLPIVDKESTKENFETSPIVNIVYPETNRVGLDIIGDIQDIGVWTEVAYSSYQDDQFDDRVTAALGADYKFANDLYLVGQGYYQQSRLDSKDGLKAVNLHFDKPVFDFHELETTAIYEMESETTFIESQFNYSLANSTELQIGGTYTDSEQEEAANLINSLADDRLYTRLQIDF